MARRFTYLAAARGSPESVDTLIGSLLASLAYPWLTGYARLRLGLLTCRSAARRVGQAWACPRFLPQGSQRSPGSGPARRAVAAAMRSSLEAGGAAPYPARRSGRSAAAKPPPSGCGPRSGPAAVTRPRFGPGPARSRPGTSSRSRSAAALCCTPRSMRPPGPGPPAHASDAALSWGDRWAERPGRRAGRSPDPAPEASSSHR